MSISIESINEMVADLHGRALAAIMNGDYQTSNHYTAEISALIEEKERLLLIEKTKEDSNPKELLIIDCEGAVTTPAIFMTPEKRICGYCGKTFYYESWPSDWGKIAALREGVKL